MKFQEFTDDCQHRLDKLFNVYLKNSTIPAKKLQDAMTYAVLNGGKRIRPLLVYATGYALNASTENSDPPAIAIELIHAYSLIHDDLPAMDNSDLRRGKPACHKAFDEATAILAGDALQPLAFEILATHPATLEDSQRLAMIRILSDASGYQGMVSGQALDLAGTDAISEMYQLKTGALLIASVKLGAVAANVRDKKTLTALETFAKNIGLAFQMQDDLLDIEDSAITGKPKGLDTANKKITFPSLLGIEKTRAMIEELYSESLTALKTIGEKTLFLKELAEALLQRKK